LVIGAGVAGLTTAVCLAEGGLAVRIRASKPPPKTTSAVAGAIVGGPVFADPVEAAMKWHPVEAATKWHRASLEEFGAMAAQQGTGVRMVRGRMVSQQGADDQSWARQLPGYQPCTPEEHAGFPVAFWISLPLVDMPHYLEYLTNRFAAAGGEMEIQSVASLDEAAAEAPVVVNCSGIGARGLAADQLVFSVRGQHVVVENPGIGDFFFERSPGSTSTSYLPHGQRLVLGGTSDKDDWSLDSDPAQTEGILRRCAAVEPRIAGAHILSVHVGLRAARPQIRLEHELVGSTCVIHNYGHSSVGVGMSWGCAREVRQLVLGTVCKPLAGH
jgi:D-amino-acid oxidase